jgi:GR25 family glycosyltransferase involved in LPS biosynthesis
MENSLHTHLPVSIHNNVDPCYKPKKQENIFKHTVETRRILSKLGGVFYINLDRRPDRRSEIEEELMQYGIYTGYTNVERFPAIDTPGKGIVGCTYSHLAVYKLAKERGYKNVLILEDDFVFIKKREDVYENLRKLFDSEMEYDVCMLAYNNVKSALPTEYDFLLKIVESQTASGYIVNSSMYDRLIELYEWAAPLLKETNQHWIYANDQVWKILQKNENAKWYCFKERLGKQMDGYSDNSGKFMELMEH